MKLDRLSREVIDQARLLLSYIPYTGCGVTAEDLRQALGLDNDDMLVVLLNIIEHYLGVVISRGTLEEHDPVRFKNDITAHYWVARGEMNRKRTEAIVKPILEREDRCTAVV